MKRKKKKIDQNPNNLEAWLRRTRRVSECRSGRLAGRPQRECFQPRLRNPALPRWCHLHARGQAATVSVGAACRAPAGSQIAAKELISQISLSFLELRDVDRKSVNSSQWQLHGFCIINYLYGARHSNYHPDEYDILIRQALILIALQHLTVSAGPAW